MTERTAEPARRRVARYELDSQFALAYADQNEHVHQALVDAVKSGRITAEPGV